MKIAAIYLAYAFSLTYATWVLYLAVMNLSKANKAGTRAAPTLEGLTAELPALVWPE